ncbi:MAG: phosphopyruvate hydratase [Deltaproteobacteria bacterium]|nr:phosphopyruvate hydratase [Deltaproteobacteria bacterium]
MAKIREIVGREILDSRGWPTLEVDIRLDDGTVGRGAVPSGASTGSFEALELRDGDQNRFLGRGVQKAIKHIVREIGPRLIGYEIGRQKELDQLLLNLDGTEEKSRLGANTILAVSIAYARATAGSRKIPLYRSIAELAGRPGTLLPLPMMNVINGGRHADNNIDIQEFMIVPAGSTFAESLRIGAEVFQSLKKNLTAKNLSVAVGDEGGFAPRVESIREILQLLIDAVEKAGYRPGEQVYFALDVAASEFFVRNEYRLRSEEGVLKRAQELSDYYRKLKRDFPVVSIEDGLSEEDWAGWAYMTSQLGGTVQLVGDDLFVTNKKRLERGIEQRVANAVLIKLNQIGTVSETLETMHLAWKAGYRTIVSHRSGETEDPFIADFAVGTGAGQIKTGSLSRSERLAKYNQLIRIEEELGPRAQMAKTEIFSSPHRPVS